MRLPTTQFLIAAVLSFGMGWAAGWPEQSRNCGKFILPGPAKVTGAVHLTMQPMSTVPNVQVPANPGNPEAVHREQNARQFRDQQSKGERDTKDR